MELKLREKEGLRIYNPQDYSSDESVFTDIVFSSNSNDEKHIENLGISVYNMHQIFILRKDHNVKVFIFRKNDKVNRKDLEEYWRNGELLFTNSNWSK